LGQRRRRAEYAWLLGPTERATIQIEEPNMRTRPFDRILLAMPALALISGAANALTPTLEVQAGLLASMPITTGSISFGGLTVNGVPVVGSIEAPELQVNGSVALAAFIPLDVDSTVSRPRFLGHRIEPYAAIALD
jgi:hypothetical protein